MKVNLQTGCMLWQGGKGSHGYGVYKQKLAHRTSYKVWIGPIPEDYQVLHKCDVRPCINPDHLFIGTPRDNMHDMMSKGRRVGRDAGKLCYRGHDNWYTAPATGKRYCRTCYNINKRGKTQ